MRVRHRPTITAAILAACSFASAAPPSEALFDALLENDAAAVSAALAAGAEPDAVRNGMPALHWAVLGGDRAAVRALIAAGAGIDAADAFGFTPLMRAAEAASPAMITLLLDQGADGNRRDGGGRTVAHQACAANDPALVEALLAGGVDFSVQDAAGRTPAFVSALATGKDRRRTLGLLGAAGAAMDLGDGSFTPLGFAAEMDDEALLADLLAAGASPDVKGPDGTPPLISGAGSQGITTRLLAAGADPDATNEEGETALFVAVESGSRETVEALLAAGADPDHRDARGQSALERARALAREEMVALLEDLAAPAPAEERAVVAPAPDPGRPDRELTLLPKLAMVSALSATGPALSYFSSASVPELLAHYRRELGERDWAEGELRTDEAAHASGSWSRGGDSLSLSLSTDASTEAPRVMVMLVAHGSVNAGELPRVASAQALFESAPTAMFVTSLAVGEVLEDTLGLLRAEGWEGNVTVDTDALAVASLRRGTSRLSVQISQAPAQDNRTTIQYNVTQVGG